MYFQNLFPEFWKYILWYAYVYVGIHIMVYLYIHGHICNSIYIYIYIYGHTHNKHTHNEHTTVPLTYVGTHKEKTLVTRTSKHICVSRHGTHQKLLEMA